MGRAVRRPARLARENGAHERLELVKTQAQARAERASSVGEPSPLSLHKKRAARGLVFKCDRFNHLIFFLFFFFTVNGH